MINKKIYYLWGLFTSQELEYLNFIKEKVQSKLVCPYFDLHITLAGPYLNINKTFTSKLKTFAEKIHHLYCMLIDMVINKKCLNHFIFQ